jgi:hypothetical protein
VIQDHEARRSANQYLTLNLCLVLDQDEAHNLQDNMEFEANICWSVAKPRVAALVWSLALL